MPREGPGRFSGEASELMWAVATSSSETTHRPRRRATAGEEIVNTCLGRYFARRPDRSLGDTRTAQRQQLCPAPRSRVTWAGRIAQQIEIEEPLARDAADK